MSDNDKVYELIISKIDNLHEDIKEIKKDVKTQNSRVGKLENFKSYIVGITVGISGIVGIVIKLLW